MPINQTLNYLRNEQTLITLCFSDSVTTSDKYLKGAGGIAGDGFPMPAAGVLLEIRVYDGSNVLSDADEVEFAAGDRISVYAVYDVDHFIVYIRKNGVNISIHADGVSANTYLLATAWLRLDKN